MNDQWRHLHRRAVIFLIRLYQKTISFDHGLLKHLYPQGFCRFYPTCSEYSVQAIEKKGILRGTTLICWRLLRCNPLHPGGVDEVEPK